MNNITGLLNVESGMKKGRPVPFIYIKKLFKYTERFISKVHQLLGFYKNSGHCVLVTPTDRNTTNNIKWRHRGSK